MLARLIALALLCLAAPANAQDSVAASPPAPATTRIVIETSEGNIVVALETERAPVTAGNFLRYVDARRYDGAIIYRAMNFVPGAGLIQGGIRDARRLYPPIAHEPTSRTGLSHLDGAISMGRDAPGTAQSDFFITVGDAMTVLDAGPNSGGDLLGFPAFGRVVEGMDVVRRILAAPVSATEGEGAMRGQMLAPPIRIIRIRRAP
jgi:peptidyl-prolyl cis-trans isomerase A (cyclophilin A)